MPKLLKPRKPRGIKLNGQPSLDMCTCYSFHCDPMTVSRKFSQKISRRLAAGVHPPCGTMPCTCKSSLSMGYKGKPVLPGQVIDDEVKRSIRIDNRHSNQYWADLLGVSKKVIYDIKHERILRTKRL
jgi:hypothetical protein